MRNLFELAAMLAGASSSLALAWLVLTAPPIVPAVRRWFARQPVAWRRWRDRRGYVGRHRSDRPPDTRNFDIKIVLVLGTCKIIDYGGHRVFTHAVA